MDQLKIGERIRQRRQLLSLEQEEVSRLLKEDSELRGSRVSASVSHISRVESGKSGRLSVDELRAFARVLDTSMTWLLDGENPDLSKAVETFAPSDAASRALVDIANAYLTGTDRDRSHLEYLLTTIAQHFSRRDSDPSDLKITSLCHRN